MYSNKSLNAIFYIYIFLIYLNRPKNNDDEDFYFTDLEDEDEAIETDTNTTTTPPLPPTLSHSDMARPPHEDPEYQRKIVGNIRQGLLMSSGSANGQNSFAKSGPITSGSNTVIHNYAWSQASPVSDLQIFEIY